MKLYNRRWLLLAAMTVGTAVQLTACRDQAAMFALRTAFSSVTLPIDVAIRQFLLGY